MGGTLGQKGKSGREFLHSKQGEEKNLIQFKKQLGTLGVWGKTCTARKPPKKQKQSVP